MLVFSRVNFVPELVGCQAERDFEARLGFRGVVVRCFACHVFTSDQQLTAQRILRRTPLIALVFGSRSAIKPETARLSI